MIIARLSIATLSGLASAAAMLWLMQWLVTSPQNKLAAVETAPIIDFVRLKQEDQLRLKERLQPPPPPQQLKPLPRPQLDLNPDIKPLAPELDMAFDLNLPMGLAGGPYLGPVATQLDRDFMPLSRQPPQYPYKATRRGIEGWVRVSFRVTETGTVEDVQVLESDPTGVFEQAAIKAVYRWRFKPRIVNGQATAGTAEQVVEFALKQ
ncbi:MAG: energy transducer TonB [Pseudomonadota bacterium]|nr:energy transducer TonB [Pseudomonadota bacterium]